MATVTGLQKPLFFWHGTTEESEIYIVPKGIEIRLLPKPLVVPDGVSIPSVENSACLHSAGMEQAQK